jgi:hypothetical protein
MEKGIKNFQDLFGNIVSSNKEFFDNIKKNGGVNLHFRAFTAQILWLTLFYNIGILLIPVKQFLLSNAILVIVVIFYAILRGVISDKIPDWIDSYTKGNFFYKCDLCFLNKLILGLVILVAGLIFLNIHLNNSKLYGNKR